MRRVRAQSLKLVAPRVHRVVAPENLAAEWQPALRFLVRIASVNDNAVVERLTAAGVDNIGTVAADELVDGDVVVPREGNELVVLHREVDLHHSLLLTNRCNSYCLMCSQPPTSNNDSWLVDEALEVICHIRSAPLSIGLTGGEPLLLGSRLRNVIEAIAQTHPTTNVEVLTNGRLLANAALGDSLLGETPPHVSWLVPLYGHADFFHDFVVQSPGAFEQTISGLLRLQEHRQAIQLRIVLIEPVLSYLPELCGFVGRNLPFVREVALMACEPIGFALANREACEVDLSDWHPTLEQACANLRRHAVPFLFMNTPLCALPVNLRPHAHRSISDWKNSYADECNGCSARAACSGLFKWHDQGWKPSRIKAIAEIS
jgi:His-Xaa-Ser system radical SAM maturase HxsC